MYNGITVVARAIRGRSQSMLYDKTDLLERAHDARKLERSLEEGGRQLMVVSHGACDLRTVERANRHERSGDR